MLHRYDCKVKLQLVSVAFHRFAHIVSTTPGTEEQKYAVAVAIYSNASGIKAGKFFSAMNRGGGLDGVLRLILSWL